MRPLPLILTSLLLALPATAQEPASKPTAKLVEAGQLVYLQDGKPFGGERYGLYASGDTHVMRVSVTFDHAKVHGAGRLVLGKGMRPQLYSFLVERPAARLRIEATLKGDEARCTLTQLAPAAAKKQTTQALLDRKVSIDAGMAVVEEGLLSLDALALRRYDRKAGGVQTIKVLVPQLGAVHELKVEAKGKEQVRHGAKRERKSQALRLHVRYRGAAQDYWVDDKGRLLVCKGKSAAGVVEIVRVSDQPPKRPTTRPASPPKSE